MNERLIKHRGILFIPYRLHFTIITFLPLTEKKTS